MPVSTRHATHYIVVCTRCRKDAEVCPRRQTDLDVWYRAVSAFERAGWHQDLDRSRRMHARNDARNFGDGKWYCPECAKARG